MTIVSAKPPCECGHPYESHDDPIAGAVCVAPGCDCDRYEEAPVYVTEATDRVAMAQHGTSDAILPPSALLAVARLDMARRAANSQVARKGEGVYVRYAFWRAHVVRAKHPSDILMGALNMAVKLKRTDIKKLSLLRLTQSIDNLQEAIALAQLEEK